LEAKIGFLNLICTLHNEMFGFVIVWRVCFMDVHQLQSVSTHARRVLKTRKRTLC